MKNTTSSKKKKLTKSPKKSVKQPKKNETESEQEKDFTVEIVANNTNSTEDNSMVQKPPTPLEEIQEDDKVLTETV